MKILFTCFFLYVFFSLPILGVCRKVPENTRKSERPCASQESGSMLLRREGGSEEEGQGS